MAGHAILSPSSASQWTTCRAAIGQQMGIPNGSSDAAEEGTAAHEVSETCLRDDVSVYSLVGQKFNGFTVTDDMAKYLDKGYIGPIKTMAQGGTLLIEQRLSIAHITGEKGAKGTSDAVIFQPGELIIADLKYGMGVQVYAERNKQLCIYAMAALEEFSIVHDFDQVRICIFQPRLNHADEWVISVSDLLTMQDEISESAGVVLSLVDMRERCKTILEYEQQAIEHYAPSETACRWCRAKATCGPLLKHNLSIIVGEFEDISQIDSDTIVQAKRDVGNADIDRLAQLLPHLDLIQSWCKAVLAKAEADAHNGIKIPGYKMVSGKRGNRKWDDAEVVAELLSGMRVKHSVMYNYSLISPTEAEKRLAETPKKWAKLESHIFRAPAGLTLVPESDKRPEVTIGGVAEMFDAVNSSDELI